MAAIRTERLAKHFTPEIRAVDGIDLTVDEGAIFGFLGANGSGKTTTVRMLTTLLRPTAGRAEVAGLNVQRRGGAVRRSIGVALQEAGLDDLQTGRELLTLQARLYRVPRRDLADRVPHLLHVVDLEDAADRRIKTSPAACSVDWTSPRRWCTVPRSCFSTSPRPDWIQSAAKRSGAMYRSSIAVRE